MEFKSIDHINLLSELAGIKLSIYETAAQLKDDDLFTKEKAVEHLLKMGMELQLIESFHLEQVKQALVD